MVTHIVSCTLKIALIIIISLLGHHQCLLPLHIIQEVLLVVKVLLIVTVHTALMAVNQAPLVSMLYSTCS